LRITAFRQLALLELVLELVLELALLVLVLVLVLVLPEQSMIDLRLEPSQQLVLAQSTLHRMLELSESFQLVRQLSLLDQSAEVPARSSVLQFGFLELNFDCQPHSARLRRGDRAQTHPL
jgi:hypothetical protein